MTRIFITGATGFIGARVLRQLVKEGREVAILLRESSDCRRIDDLLDKCTLIWGDLESIDVAKDAIKSFDPKVVLHLAWDGVKGFDRNNSKQISNVSASINLYQLTEKLGCEHFIGLGSQAEYGLLSGRINENAQTRPTTVYGTAKLATGILLESIARSSAQSFTWLRLFSSYGPDDDPSWLIPYLIQTLLAGQKPSLTKAEQVWDYIHVDDVAAGIIASIDSKAYGVFNLGSGQGRPLNQIIKMIRDGIDQNLPLGFGDIKYRQDQVMHLEADITALVTASKWLPAITLEDGIMETVNWYKKGKLHAN